MTKPLTSTQERRLVEYLDEKFLNLARNFKKRSEPTSTLRTLPTYLEESSRILSFILQIPPIDPSTSLRVAYLLRLTGDVLGATPGYRVTASGEEAAEQQTLSELLDFLDDLDQAWITVLQGQVWDPEMGEGKDLITTRTYPTSKSTPPSQTDVARLRSLLFSGQSILEEWLTNQRPPLDIMSDSTPSSSADVGAEDLSTILSRMGLLDKFDSLFTKTLDHIGGFSNSAIPGEEVVMSNPVCA